MPEDISGTVFYNDLQQFAYLDENTGRSLLTIDVQPFKTLNAQDARFAYSYLKQRPTALQAPIHFQGQRISINGSPIIVIAEPF